MFRLTRWPRHSRCFDRVTSLRPDFARAKSSANQPSTTDCGPAPNRCGGLAAGIYGIMLIGSREPFPNLLFHFVVNGRYSDPNCANGRINVFLAGPSEVELVAFGVRHKQQRWNLSALTVGRSGGEIDTCVGSWLRNERRPQILQGSVRPSIRPFCPRFPPETSYCS